MDMIPTGSGKIGTHGINITYLLLLSLLEQGTPIIVLHTFDHFKRNDNFKNNFEQIFGLLYFRNIF